MTVQMNDTAFLILAEKIGNALQKDRLVEDQHRKAGREDLANQIYLTNKECARILLVQSGLSPRDFDQRLRKVGSGRRINVKLQNMFDR